MLDLKFISSHPEKVIEALKTRGISFDLSRIQSLSEKRSELIQKTDELRSRKNDVSSEIAQMKRDGDDASQPIKEMKEIGQRIKILGGELDQAENELHETLLHIPNLPHESVKVGKDEKDNIVVRTWGEKPLLNFKPKAHWDLGEDLGILDFKGGAKLTGARFTLYRKEAAQMERALINFMLDLHTQNHGYAEVLPPFIMNRESMTVTGQLPKFEEDAFKLADMDYFLVPTAEVPLTNIHTQEIISEKSLPLSYAAFTPCFRREAGSYGKDVRGLIRQHQFNKVELVKVCKPDQSYEALDQLTQDAETVLQKLGLHYRVVLLCTGDMGFSAAKTYDIEVWLPGQGTYREISSCSNCEDFQARRGKIRYRPQEGGKPRLVHTLNGSGLAVGRTLISILENYQQEDGSVIVPEALRPYMNGLEKIT